MLAGIEGLKDLTLHERFPVGTESTHAGGRGIETRHREPGLTGDATFKGMNDVGFGVDRVLEGIERPRAPGCCRSRSTWW